MNKYKGEILANAGQKPLPICCTGGLNKIKTILSSISKKLPLKSGNGLYISMIISEACRMKTKAKKSNIANIFRAYSHNNARGGYIEDGLTWYLYKRDGQKI